MTLGVGEGAMSWVRRRPHGCLLVLSAAVLLVVTVPTAGALQDEVSVLFDFSPAKSAYNPGDNLTLEFRVRNAMLNGTPALNNVRVWNVSAYFSWMAPNDWASMNVSGESRWLYPGEMQEFGLNLTVPADSTSRTYTYILKVEYSYIIMPEWGASRATWESVPYHDFVVEVAEPPGEEPKVDYVPYVAGMALVLALGSIGAYLYHRKGEAERRRRMPMGSADALGLAEVPGAATYPVIKALPGERFPIERGFVYLVKEKRPRIGFAMFAEATKHGAKGLLVAREHPNRLKQMYEFEAVKILWLTRRVGVDHIDPTELSLLSLDITKFVEGTPKSVVLLEGLEYMITQNDFESVLRFINHLHDVILAHDCAIVVVLDPRVLSTRELALLERSARIVEPAEPVEGRDERPSEELEA